MFFKNQSEEEVSLRLLRVAEYCLVGFLFMNVLDVLTTWYAIFFKITTEANPILNYLFDNLGLYFGLYVKMLVALFLFLIWLKSINKRITQYLVIIMFNLFSFVVLWNCFNLGIWYFI